MIGWRSFERFERMEHNFEVSHILNLITFFETLF